MKRVLLTAFEPYDRWKANSSWLALVHLTQDLPAAPAVTTRLYPVDFAAVRQRLAEDLRANYDFAIHLGQAPGSSRIQLEAVAINVGGASSQTPDQFRPLVDGGPVGYQSPLPVGDWSLKLRRQGIPAQVSYHCGTYLCNAVLYLSCHLAHEMGLKTQSLFVHLPLETSQAAAEGQALASLPVATTAAAVRSILDELAGRE